MSFLRHMQSFTVHLRPGALEANSREYPLFVREGFNWPAFFVTFFWMLYHRIWLPSLGVVALQTAVVLAQQGELINHASALIVLLGMQTIVGFHANDWYRASLRRRGYTLAGVVTSDTQVRAEQRFFEQYLAERRGA